MNPHARFRLTILLLFVLLVVGIFLGATVSAQQANLNEAIKAVVRIRGCNITGCNVDLGSGVIIDPSGVILTANHVTLTDPKNSLSPHLEDFVIEITDDARQAPQARYRANLIAAKPESDLALLRIYQDEVTNQSLDDPNSIHLPALALADITTISLSDQLHVLGYPLAGGASINYTEVALGGFDDNGALLKVNASLNEGYSGGPALVERDGHYEIVGVVIRRRGDVSLIRSIDQLRSLTWEPTARRVWLDHVQVTAQGNAADAIVKVSADIHALDYGNHDGRLLAYVFDASTQQPWSAGASNLDRSANGQLVLRQVFSSTHMVDVLPQQTLTLSLHQLNTQSNRLIFRLLLWDMNEAHVLWRDDQWRRPEQGASEVALAPTQTPTFTPLPTPMPTPTTTAIPTVASAPTPIVSNLAINAPELVAPDANFSIAGNSKTTFAWKWRGKLQPNEGFQITMWPVDKANEKKSIHDARETTGLHPDTTGVYHLNLDVASVLGNGDYEWTVMLVWLKPYRGIMEAPSRPIKINIASGGHAEPLATIQATPRPLALAPVKLAVPALKLDLPVTPITSTLADLSERVLPLDSLGWNVNSSGAGGAGRVVLSGSQAEDKAPLAPLATGEIIVGQQLLLTDSEGTVFVYRVTEVSDPIAVTGATAEEKALAASYVAPSGEAQLTLFTGWPDFTTTHLVFAVAKLVGIKK